MRIQSKIFLAILGASALLVAAVMLLAQWSVARGMVDYVNNRHMQRAQTVATELGEFYREEGSWQPLRDNPPLFHYLIWQAFAAEVPPRESDAERRFRRKERGDAPPHHHAHPPRLPPLTLFDAQRGFVVGRPTPAPTKLIAIRSGASAVGYLAVPQLRRISSGFEEEFLRRQRSSLALIGTALFAIAALIALPLARHLVKPIRQLAHGTHELTQGDYTVSLPAQRRDEFGELARDFNELALTLAANDSSRKRWLADISHELRTPLSILRGELEAILDGVRPADAAQLQSLHQEVQHLGRLVDDLHALTTADIGGLQYRKSECDIAELWRDQCAAHRQNFAAAGLTFATKIPEHPVELYGDEDRLQQLLDNLLDNSRKYTSPGGRVEVAVNALADGVELSVQDSAPAVPAEALPKLFDHLFRVEDSRNRATGGSGLGLAICRRIISAHAGDISAAPSELGGLLIRVFLPYR